MRRAIGIITILGLMCVPVMAQADVPELDVPLIQQIGDKANCGPTSAAMMIGAYNDPMSRAGLSELRDRLGSWSWDRFPVRRLSLPGYDPGASPPDVLKATLNTFAGGVNFDTVTPEHPWVPREVWSLIALRSTLESGRPVVVLVTSSVIWDMPSAVGLHWVVVRGLEDGKVIINDPADRTRRLIPTERFWTAWALDGIFATLFDRFTGLVADRAIH